MEMHVEVPLRPDGLPEMAFGAAGVVPVSPAHAARRILDEDIAAGVPSEDSAQRYLDAACAPLFVPFWQLHLPGEPFDAVELCCQLPELESIPGEIAFGLSNGWVLHDYPRTGLSLRRQTSPAISALRLIDLD